MWVFDKHFQHPVLRKQRNYWERNRMLKFKEVQRDWLTSQITFRAQQRIQISLFLHPRGQKTVSHITKTKQFLGRQRNSDQQHKLFQNLRIIENLRGHEYLC